jgi:hypothetical protein
VVTPIGILFSITDRALKFIQKKIEKSKMIRKPGLFISSHAVKIGCREVGGSWMTVKVQDKQERGKEFEYIGDCAAFPVFCDEESLYLLQNFSRLTLDLSATSNNTLILRELETP